MAMKIAESPTWNANIALQRRKSTLLENLGANGDMQRLTNQLDAVEFHSSCHVLETSVGTIDIMPTPQRSLSIGGPDTPL